MVPATHKDNLPDNTEETNEFCANFDTEAIKRCGRAGFRAWSTDFDKQKALIRREADKENIDPLLNQTITTSVYGGGSNPSSPSNPSKYAYNPKAPQTATAHVSNASVSQYTGASNKSKDFNNVSQQSAVPGTNGSAKMPAESVKSKQSSAKSTVSSDTTISTMPSLKYGDKSASSQQGSKKASTHTKLHSNHKQNGPKIIKSSPTTKYNTDPTRHKDIEHLIREGENKFHNLGSPLKSIGEADPNEYLHPNWNTRKPAALTTHVKRTTMPARITWDGEVTKFLAYKKQVTGFFMQCGAGYLFNKEFQALWLQYGEDCLLHFDTHHNARLNKAQMKDDIELLYGALTSSLTNMAGDDHLLAYQDTHDGLSAWIDLTNEFDQGGSKDLRITTLEKIISTKYHTHYKGGLSQFVSDYKTAFMELTTLGVKEWLNDTSKKRRLVANLAPLGFYWLNDAAQTKTFPELATTLKNIALTAEAEGNSRAIAKAKVAKSSNNRDRKANLTHIKANLYKQLPHPL